MGHNSLALRVNLSRRGKKLDKRCVMCGRHDEDGAHLFFKCKYVRHIWAEMQLEQVRQEMAEMLSAREVLEAILKMKMDTQSRVITLMYLWWSERCRRRAAEK